MNRPDAVAAKPDSEPLIDVAVGVVVRSDGAVLLGQRVAGKPYAGWWEFPGGKVEAGETVAEALARELHEELGLEVRASMPWVVREFVYPHARVRLFFRRVVDFIGEARGREGQAFVWRRPDAIDVAPLLPATIPVLAWLRLPTRYAISDATRMGASDWLDGLDAALAERSTGPRGARSGGAMLLQLREPQMPARAFELLFEAVRERCDRAGCTLLVSSRHPQSFWHAADGVHLTARDLLAREGGARPAVRRVSASCHVAAELAVAGRLGCDFAVLGHVQQTPSHPDRPAMGWDGFAEAVAATPVPVFALGGLAPGDLPAAQVAGAHGIAMQRAAWVSRLRRP